MRRREGAPKRIGTRFSGGRVRKVRHSASAENDLLEAWLFVAEESVEAADQLLDQIQAESRTLLFQLEMVG